MGVERIFSLTDRNVGPNGGYNPWLIFETEADMLACQAELVVTWLNEDNFWEDRFWEDYYLDMDMHGDDRYYDSLIGDVDSDD